MDDLLIVKVREVLRLSRFRALWVLGWMVATAALTVAGIQTARLHEAEQHREEIRQLTQHLESVAAKQALVNEGLMQTLNQQNRTADLLISWGSYVKARADLSRQNLNTPQFATIRAPRKVRP